MACSTWLQAAADITTIATSLASWRSLLGLALAIIAWVAVRRHWRKVRDALHLGTQMGRLQDEQFILLNVVYPENYLRLSPAIRNRATSSIRRYVSAPSMCGQPDGSTFLILILVLSSLNADVLDCQARYLALPTLGWLQYIDEVFDLYTVVRATLKRLHDVQREIEVSHCKYI